MTDINNSGPAAHSDSTTTSINEKVAIKNSDLSETSNSLEVTVNPSIAPQIHNNPTFSPTINITNPAQPNVNNGQGVTANIQEPAPWHWGATENYLVTLALAAGVFINAAQYGQKSWLANVRDALKGTKTEVAAKSAPVMTPVHHIRHHAIGESPTIRILKEIQQQDSINNGILQDMRNQGKSKVSLPADSSGTVKTSAPGVTG